MEDQKELMERTVEEANPNRQYATSNGDIPKRYASAEDLLLNAPKDIIEQDIEDVFGGLTIRVRGLTASQAAHVKQQSFNVSGRGGAEVAWSRMEIAQFELGVIEPSLTHDQVLMLHRTSGPSFTKVISVLDEISGIGKEELREAQKEFQEREQ
jgi:hypothetical protein